MASVAASGGYYAACGADTIIANPGTTTGSIGVIAQFVTMHELFKKIGIEYKTIKSGQFKDTGSMHRPMTTADRRYLQTWINDAYDQFVGVVSRERGLSREATVKLADGRVYTGRQAYKSGLVDLLGDFHYAVEIITDMAGISGTPALVRVKRSKTSLFDLLLQQAQMAVRGSNGQVLMYRFL
jgi:protease-4